MPLVQAPHGLPLLRVLDRPLEAGVCYRLESWGTFPLPPTSARGSGVQSVESQSLRPGNGFDIYPETHITPHIFPSKYLKFRTVMFPRPHSKAQVHDEIAGTQAS